MTRRTFHWLPPKEKYPSRKSLETKPANRHCKKKPSITKNRSFYSMFITEIEIGYSFLNYQTLFESNELIQNNDRIKMLRLAEQN
jgi:hypothetical protein